MRNKKNSSRIYFSFNLTDGAYIGYNERGARVCLTVGTNLNLLLIRDMKSTYLGEEYQNLWKKIV